VATLEQARALTDLLVVELGRRTGEVRRNQNYYRGVHPLKYASEQFADYFAKRYDGFCDNWTQVIADSPVERLTVTGIRAAGADSADTDLWQVWQRNGLDADSQLGFLGAVSCARTFVLVWGDPKNPDMPEVTFEDASSAIVLYEPGSRRKRRAAMKLWQDGFGEYATLYLPDEVWKFHRPLSNVIIKPPLLASADEQIRSWDPREVGLEPNPQPNPMGVVPMVELPNRPLLVEQPISDISGVIAMQDAINLLWSQLLVASDFASLAQRIVIGAEVPKIPVLDANGQKVGEKPVDLKRFALDRVLWLENPEAKVANWPSADLTAYTSIIEVAVGHIAAQTRTPAHYLIGKMANLSGDALIAAETGLVKKCEEKQLWFGQALREVFALIAMARGETAKAAAIGGGTLLWADVQSRNIAQLTDSLLKLKQIGFPFEFLASRFGLTPTEVADLMQMREREAELDPVAAMMNAATVPMGNPDASADGAADQNPD
jgi:SPP1 Gp6-like portal protein